jgi:hypothetical protein
MHYSILPPVCLQPNAGFIQVFLQSFSITSPITGIGVELEMYWRYIGDVLEICMKFIGDDPMVRNVHAAIMMPVKFPNL